MERLKTFDLNIFSQIIQSSLEEFNFGAAHSCMEKLNHAWVMETDYDGKEICRVPTILEIEREVRKRLTNDFRKMVNSGLDSWFSSTGGYVLECYFSEDDGYWARIMYAPVETLL